jgi:hypothetical protein
VPDINRVETDDDYIHVRFRDPDQFDEIRTPDWAEDAAQSVSESADVRTGRKQDGDDWQIQSVLVDKHVGEEKAKEQARGIVEKIQS